MLKHKRNPWIRWGNYLVLQWFFCRIYRKIDMDGSTVELGLMAPVVPTTGWSTPFKPSSELRKYLPLWRLY